MPLVSVILPSFNRLRSLPRAIASVLAQTMGDLELIVVDDGSTDGTREYLKGLSDPRLKVIELDENRGAAGARNVGIENAIGNLIAFQDSDDEWLVSFLEKQVSHLQSSPQDVGICYCGKAIYGRNDRRKFGPRRMSYMPDLSRSVVEGDIYMAVLRNPLVSTQTFVVKSEIIRRVGGFDETIRIGIDWELSTRLAKITKYAFIPEPLVLVFISDDSITLNVGKTVHTIKTIIQNNKDVFDNHPKMLADKLLQIAGSLQRVGQAREGMSYLKKAFFVTPLYMPVYKGLLRMLWK